MANIFGTVVFSRVRSRENVLILRPFDKFLFRRHAAEGPTYLLEQLGKGVDWEVYRERKHPYRACS
eukprot:5575196-Amphidinium_carterae.1